MSAATIILASGSPIRRDILKGAGIKFSVCKPSVDESALKKRALKDGVQVPEIALMLAQAKAEAVDAGPNDIIIGADQIMEMDGQIFDKPKTMAEAKSRLWMMRANTHRLIGGLVCLNKKTGLIWTHKSVTSLMMRGFSEQFLDDYLKREGEDILYTVGAYKFEGRGAQLFTDVKGDFFSVLGLSLLPLLGHLRDIGAIDK